MPRQARIDIANHWYHIVVRGINKEAIFRDDSDKLLFLRILAKLLIFYDIKLGAFCLMDNHLHLLLFRGRTSLYKFMHRLLTKYSIYFNKKYNRVGHLFQDRYKSFIVLDERYLLVLVNYIHGNPERAGMVN
ncbi:transposase, partial [bacterium]|nr:transposase [bacterium]